MDEFCHGEFSIIGTYHNKDGKIFDFTGGLGKKCPSCGSEILESNCNKCCHDEGCGEVNSYEITTYHNLDLYYREANKFSDPIFDAKSCYLENIRKYGLKHHMCSSCGYELFTYIRDGNKIIRLYYAINYNIKKIKILFN